MSNNRRTIDWEIMNINKAICRHIDSLQFFSRGVVSQDILGTLRTFLEHIMLKFYSSNNEIENTYQNICKAISFSKTRSDLKIIARFHDYLQIVASHYIQDEENSERIMLKYYEFLLKTKDLLYDRFSLVVLENLHKFPINIDKSTQEYYEKIAQKIELINASASLKPEKYYVKKIKPFFVDSHVYYEVTLTPANDYTSKFNRIIAFTKIEISDNYAVQLSFAQETICNLDKKMPILIIVKYSVAIRECEFKNFSKLIHGNDMYTRRQERQVLSEYLTNTGFNLVELINFPEESFQTVKSNLTQKNKTSVFLNDLEYCRSIVCAKKAGANLIMYLLLHMNNKIIKQQYYSSQNRHLSNLYVKNGCIPFDNMPYASSLIGHNPKLKDIFASIDISDKKHELLARLVINNTEIKGQLFTPIKQIVDYNYFEDVHVLVEKFNERLWCGHFEDRKILIGKNHLYVNGYLQDTRFILSELSRLSCIGIQNYSNSVISWLNSTGYFIDCDEKKEALVKMFEQSSVALIYGAAGTGKSTFINHISHFFSDKEKLFLAQTNPAVDNLKRRVTTSKCTYSTIAKFLGSKNSTTEYDLLIIDECSTVSNRDMKKVLEQAKYKLIILVGDTYQISSIRFGNWFSMSQDFISSSSVFELRKPYRNKNEHLLSLWNKVRQMDDDLLEYIVKQDYSKTLDSSLFETSGHEEIILCLNYDGLYGINNINRYLQESNPSPSMEWGVQQYKVNDPILFNESERFAPVIYNNMKGRIISIEIRASLKTTNNVSSVV